MYCTYLGRRAICAPHRFWQLFRLGLLVFEQVGDRRWELLHLFGVVEKVHLIVAIAHLVRQAAGPSLDLIKLVSLLVVPGLADIDLDVR